MRLLVLGGTVFLGRAVVEESLRRGCEVTLFHRGMHGGDLFPEAEHVLGDRDGGLGALDGRSWDAVIDTCGYVPRIVGQSAQAFRDRVSRYLFVSTISVYKDPSDRRLDEDSALSELDDTTTEEVTGETYGGLKVLCEREVFGAYGDHGLVVRPGIIAGPWDPTNRFTYWADRMAEGGEVLAPNRPDQPEQLIDVRDLAAFMLGALEAGLDGPYNATGPERRMTLLGMLDACRQERDAEIVWADEEFLASRGISLWQDLPLTLPGSGEIDGMMSVDCSRAIEDGLRFRSVSETARDTHAWSVANPVQEPRHGFGRDEEREAIRAWRAAGEGNSVEKP